MDCSGFEYPWPTVQCAIPLKTKICLNKKYIIFQNLLGKNLFTFTYTKCNNLLRINDIFWLIFYNAPPPQLSLKMIKNCTHIYNLRFKRKTFKLGYTQNFNQNFKNDEIENYKYFFRKQMVYRRKWCDKLRFMTKMWKLLKSGIAFI